MPIPAAPLNSACRKRHQRSSPALLRGMRLLFFFFSTLSFGLIGCESGRYNENHPFNHNPSNQPFNHTSAESPFQHNAQPQADSLQHKTDPFNPITHDTYGRKDGGESVSTTGLRWHLCSCLVQPSSFPIPRRSYTVCARDPIDADSFSDRACRPLLAPRESCSTCVCYPLSSCTQRGLP